MLLLGTLSLSGFWAINSEFAVYDDEGYALYSLMDFARSGALYTELYSQYGPFFFFYHATLFDLLDLPWTHDAGRLVTLMHWLAAAAACGGITALLTRSMMLGWAGMAVAFMLLQLSFREPNHPGALCAMIIAGGTFLALACRRRQYTHSAAVLLGISGTALILIKINVGLFFLLAAGVALLLDCRSFRGRQILLWTALAGTLTLPWVLMHALLHDPWVRTYALNFCTATAIAALFLPPPGGSPSARQPATVLPAYAAGALSCLIVVTLYMLATGSTLYALFDGIILGPLRHPGVLNIPFPWLNSTYAAAGLALLIAILIKLKIIPKKWLNWIRGVAVLALFLLAFEPQRTPLAYWIFNYFPLFMVCFAVPLTPKEQGAGLRLVSLVLLFQYLHAYPVAGSQVFWSVFLAAPLWLFALGNLLPAAPYPSTAARRTAILLPIAAFLLAFAAIIPFARKAYTNYSNFPHLQLPGSADMRTNTMLGTTLRVMDANIRRHADVLFTMPGMMSLNLWADVPPPTRQNATQWFSLLDLPAQQEIADKLAASPHAIWVVADWHVQYLQELGLFRDTPLVQSLESDWERAFSFRRFSFWVHPGRTLVPWQSIMHAPENVDQHANFVLSCLPFTGNAEKLVLNLTARGKTRRLTLDAGNTRITAAEITDDGQLLNAPASLPWPLTIDRPMILWVETDHGGNAQPTLDVRSHAVFVDTNDQIISEFIHIQPVRPLIGL